MEGLDGRSEADGETSFLVERAYLELREVAERLLTGERTDHTLQPTALVHEAWLKLDATGPFVDRTHFVAASAKAMRRVLVDHARGRGRDKRGGQWRRVALDGLLNEQEEGEVSLVELDVALAELEEAAPRQARLVELRFFGGFEVDEAARLLEVSPITAARDWRFARAWLARRLAELGIE